MSQHEYCLLSDRLALRYTCEADLPYVLETENHPANTAFIVPWLKARHTEAILSPREAHLIVESIQEKCPIGYIILTSEDTVNDSICLQRIVIQSKGKGYGREALRLCKKYVFTEKAIHRLWLDVKVHNERAYQLYLSEGFQEEGILRDALKEGEGFVSLRVMSVLRPDFYTGK